MLVRFKSGPLDGDVREYPDFRPNPGDVFDVDYGVCISISHVEIGPGPIQINYWNNAETGQRWLYKCVAFRPGTGEILEDGRRDMPQAFMTCCERAERLRA